MRLSRQVYLHGKAFLKSWEIVLAELKTEKEWLLLELKSLRKGTEAFHEAWPVNDSKTRKKFVERYKKLRRKILKLKKRKQEIDKEIKYIKKHARGILDSIFR